MFIMILTIAVIVGLLQPVSCLLLDTYKPAHHPGGNDTISLMALRLDELQEQMVQQNKTLEMQEKMIKQLLNIFNQSLSTQSQSNEVSDLQIDVQRIMNEYHKLSNISDATDLAFKVNNMTTSVRILTASLSKQEKIVRELKQNVGVLNGTISLKHKETANQIQLLTNTLSAVSQSLSTFFLLEHHNKNQLSTFSTDLNTTQSRVSSLQGTVLQNQQEVSSLSSQYSVMSSNLSALSSDLHSVESNLSSLQTTVSRNRQYSSSNIFSLSSQYSDMSSNLSALSSDLQSVESSLSSLQSTVSRNQQYSSGKISSLTNQYSILSTKNQQVSSQYSAMSSNLSALSSDLQSVESSLSSLQTTVSRNQQYSSGKISSLTNQYSTLSTTLGKTKIRVSTLEHNLQETVITGTRITGGNYSGMGRLEVLYQGSWGTVCDDYFTSNSAKVACRQVGYAWTHAIARGSAYFGPGSGDTVLDNVQCRGDELSLALCRHRGFGQEDCSHSEDVGVMCLDIRLVNGSSQRQGRVEIKLGNTWGTVCDDAWSSNDARVVCKMLGYNGTAEAFTEAHFGQGSGQIWLDNVQCTGSESSIALCPSGGFGNHNCVHGEDAGVICH